VYRQADGVGGFEMRARFVAGLLTLSVLNGHEALSATRIADKPIECETKLSAPLRVLLRKQFPRLHVPHLAELDAGAVQHDRREGGDGCYVVATGDFTGEGRQSAAMILAPVDGAKGQLLVAIETKTGWKLDKLPTYCGDVRSCYVQVLGPGTYVRTPALDGPLQADGELKEMTTKVDAVISGQMESTGVVFAFINGHWNYVWVSD
jgi:hypothetical protein